MTDTAAPSSQSTHVRILALAIPAILANFSAVLPNLVDTALVGQTGDATALGGISVGAALATLILWAFAFLRLGTAGFTAQAFGAEDGDEIKATLNRALSLAWIFGFVVLLVMVPLAFVAVPLFGLFPDALVGQASLPIGAAAAAAELTSATPSGVVAFVLSMIPSNPVAAAAEGNMVAVVVFTAVLAVAVSRGSAEARAPLEGFFRSLADAMTRLVGWIVSLAPVAVFCLALPLTVQSGGSLVGAVGFYVVAMAITCAAVTALCYPVAASGIRAFGRAMLPTQLIAASCSSSIASLPAMVRSADALAVPTRISGFVLPLAVSVFKPAAPVAWIVGALFIGKFYGVELGARELGVVALASVFVSFAAPGVPRGAFLLLTPLFEAIGLPAEGIGVLIAVDLIPDMCATVVQVTGDVTATTVIARLEQRD